MPEPKKKTTRATARKTTERKPVRKTKPRATKTPVITHEHVAERAYYLSLERGGDAFENWLQAERELARA
jgi:cell division protein FtsN